MKVPRCDRTGNFGVGRTPALARVTAAVAGRFNRSLQQLHPQRGLKMLNTTPKQFAQNYRRDFDGIVKRMQEFGIEAQ